MPALIFPFIMIFFSCILMSGTVHANEAEPGYLLGPGDILEVSVWEEEAMFREVKIRPDGKFSFPLIGDIKAHGRSVEQVRIELQERIDEYIPGAPVTVILRNLGYPRIYVVGKVAKPGPFMMDSELTVIQALAMAGGLTTFAGKSNILILRRQGGEQKTLEFNYSDLERGRNLEQNIVLIPGDTVIVP